MQPTAHSLVLQILSQADYDATPVRVLVTTAGLFDITENNLRVTLARLLSRGLIARDERGLYRLAEGGRAVKSHVAEWRHLEDRMVPWKGGWIGVHTAGLPRSNRTTLKQRMRALNFLGFRELAPDLWVRPDNLAGGTDDVRRRLRELGLEAEAPAFAMARLDPDTEARARGLWDMDALRAEYRERREAVEQAIERLDTLPQEEAMVETFLLGGGVLRLLAFDPLLPDEISSGDERREVVEAMLRYDRLGRRVWADYMRERDVAKFDSPLQFPAFDDISRSPVGVEVGV